MQGLTDKDQVGQAGHFIWGSGGELDTQAGVCVPSVEAFKLTVKKKKVQDRQNVWGPDMASWSPV